jgi:quercetin dioxygenase-like cupin family protein
VRLYRSERMPWIEGKGYWKRLLASEMDIGDAGTLLQEVKFVPGESVPLHHHQRTKEVFIALDQARFMVNGEEVTMEPGDVLVCEPGDVHGNPTIDKAIRILVIKLDFDPDDTVWL